MNFSTPRPSAKPASIAVEAVVANRINRAQNLRALEAQFEQARIEKQQLSELEAIDASVAIKESVSEELGILEGKCKKKPVVLKDALNSKLRRQCTTEVTSLAIAKIVYESCPIDADVKEDNYEQMAEIFEATMADISNHFPLRESKDQSPILKNICEEACKTAEKAAKRLAESILDGGHNADDIEFSLDDDEAEELEGNIEDLDIDQLEDSIKNKVIQVITDEMNSNKGKSAKIEEIETTMADLKQKQQEGDLSVSEAFLLESMVKQSRQLNNIATESLFSTLMASKQMEVMESGIMESSNLTDEQHFDLLLMETVIVYTVMETLNTLGMYEFTPSTVRAYKSAKAHR